MENEVYKAGTVGEPIDIILLTHGKLDLLTVPCVSAIYANTRSLFHLIIVDDTTPDMEDGKDQTAQWVRRLQVDQQNVTFVHSDFPYKSGNQIFNIGLAHGNSRFVALIMNSVLVEPDWDIVPIQMMTNNPKIGIIGMKCLKLGWGDNSDGLIESAGVYMNGFTPCDIGRDETSHRFLGAYPCASVQWAFSMVRREAVVGNLDEDLWQGFVGWDDIDNSIYLRYKGWEVWYCGTGIGYHRTHATRGSGKNDVLRKNRINAEIFFKRWGYWELFKQANPYAPEYFPTGQVKFLCDANTLPLTIEDVPPKIAASMTRQEGNVLYSLATKRAKKDTVFVEIGSWSGHSTSMIASAIKALGGHLSCVDHWKGSEGTELLKLAKDNNVYEIFANNMKGSGLWDYITPLVMSSKEAVAKFEDKSIDFLFLDGDHRYEQFKEDLVMWLPKMKVGGIICGHDCDGYYSKASFELKELLDTHLGVDFTGVYHAGVMKGLYDVFKDDYSIVKGTRIWFKEL